MILVNNVQHKVIMIFQHLVVVLQRAHHKYNCSSTGDCIIDNNGPYMSLAECEDRCSWYINNNGSGGSTQGTTTNNTMRGNYANPILRNTNISGGY